MTSTIIGLFDSHGDAQSAMNDLFKSGFTHSDVKLSPAENSPEAREAALRGNEQREPTEGGWSIGNFFRSLFGTEQHADDADLYAEALRRGSFMVSVQASSSDQRDQAADILQRYHPIDVEQRAADWRNAGWTGYQSAAPVYTEQEILSERNSMGTSTTKVGRKAADTQTQRPTQEASAETTLPVIEEQLKVGKRAVLKGGVRVYQHVTETPVEESIQLRQEHVKVQRTPVDQPATEADLAAFKEGSLEVRETAEEAIVSKTAHVVEEVTIGKEVTEHTETVSDTLRRTDVDVEQLGAEASTGQTGDDDEFRQHWQSAYGTTGGRYEDYAQAYRYGATQAGNSRYQGYRWDEVEPQVRTEWESSHAGSPWEHTKQAVRYGWEKMARH